MEIKTCTHPCYRHTKDCSLHAVHVLYFSLREALPHWCKQPPGQSKHRPCSQTMNTDVKIADSSRRKLSCFYHVTSPSQYYQRAVTINVEIYRGLIAGRKVHAASSGTAYLWRFSTFLCEQGTSLIGTLEKSGYTANLKTGHTHHKSGPYL